MQEYQQEPTNNDDLNADSDSEALCVCGVPVPKEVSYADSFVYTRMQGAAGLPSELRPRKTSDGRCENVPAMLIPARPRDSECSILPRDSECASRVLSEILNAPQCYV